MKKALVFVFFFGIFPMTALAAAPLQPVENLEPIGVTRTLNVTVSGLGTVTSNPAGINCTNGEGECSHAFQIDRSVALPATPPPSDEFGSYSFLGWSGAATGSVAAAPVVIDGIDEIFIFGPGASIQMLSDGLMAWKQGISSEVDEALLGAGVPTSALPAGTYRVFLMVTAAGNMSASYAWGTYFEITHVQLLNPFLVP